MDETARIHQHVVAEAEEVQEQIKDLERWRQEMEDKENRLKNQPPQPQHADIPPIRNSQSQKKPASNPKTLESRIKASDYEAWEKFDPDKACEKVDKEGVGPVSLDAPESEEDKKRLLAEEALYEKERGNEFVKQKMWDEAISCYNRAIELKSDDAIFYANRGLCFLKKENFHAAEADCTKSLNFDPTYVKALQRRSCAREFLGYLRSAAADLAEIIKLEPNNESVKRHHAALVQRMGTKGPNSKSSSPASSKTSSPASTPQSGSASKFFSSDAATPKEETKPMRTAEEILGDLQFTNIYDQRKYRHHYVDEESVSEPNLSNYQGSSFTKNLLAHAENAAPVRNVSSPELSSAAAPSSNAHHYNKKQSRKKKGAEPREEYVQPVIKPPHLRSQKPLRSISISEIPKGYSATPCSLKDAANGVTKLIAKHINQRPQFGPNMVPVPYEDYLRQGHGPDEQSEEISNKDRKTTANIAKCENKKPQSVEEEKIASETLSTEKYEDLISDVPKSSIQFLTHWRLLQGREKDRCRYLKSIRPKNIPTIFQNSMESDILSDIINVMDKSNDFVKGKDVKSYHYLRFLTQVKRFSSLSMFLSTEDKEAVKRILQRSKNKKECTQEEMDELCVKFEI